ncbi:hypothetical protein SAMN05444360_102178 [Chryseobacterium carnipullorum]|nr:hypothetical protein SAMN05444360_102178 [Chryseobacterium carnipullorum]
MNKNSRIEQNAVLDQTRSIKIERIVFGKKDPLFWIELTNAQTNSVYKLPALSKADIKKINDLIEKLDNFENL